jgi:hypothetical protein
MLVLWNNDGIRKSTKRSAGTPVKRFQSSYPQNVPLEHKIMMYYDYQIGISPVEKMRNT